MEYVALNELVFGNDIVKKGAKVSSDKKLDEIYPLMFAKAGAVKREVKPQVAAQGNSASN